MKYNLDEFKAEELRCYTFTLYQLSSIQQGIQAGHAAVELGTQAYASLTLDGETSKFKLYNEWATEWKTMVLLNGGDSKELRELMYALTSRDNPYPWSGFYESEDSLNGLLTSVAIILPERIFGMASKVRSGEELPYSNPPGMSYSDFELELIMMLATRKLAV